MRKMMVMMAAVRAVMRLVVVWAVAVLVSGCAGGGADSADCGGETEREGAGTKVCVRVMNWNLQTFFDGVCDGNEYEQFKGTKSSWSADKYEVRLLRLCEVLKTVDADIVVMEELEKEDQLYDISNRLTGTFNFSKLYPYGSFSAEKNAAIGCAVLSRCRIKEVHVHSLDIRSAGTQPSMRPLLEVILMPSDGVNLHLFVNHWKSKLGEGSEVWRGYQRKVLSSRMEQVVEGGGACVACGDFNADVQEFVFLPLKEWTGVYEANMILRLTSEKGEGGLRVYNPWISEEGTVLEGGSYWYDGAWEKIDHFFCAGSVKIGQFRPSCEGRWTDADGRPDKYKIWSGTGYSDHLPVVCEVILQ